MAKYHYSVIRFVPSPVRGEFVNLGLLIGSDQTGEWLIEVVGSKTRAAKLDDDNLLPMVVTDLQRLQSTVESYAEPDMFDPRVELSESWLLELSRDSRNQLQFSHPNAVLAENIGAAFEKLWGRLVVESLPTRRSSMTKATVTARYLAALDKLQLNRKHLKKRVTLETSRSHTNIDIAVHNGVVKEITQCWSLQIKSAEPLLNEIKAWGWTIKTLREQGGRILTNKAELQVPNDVHVGVIYAGSEDKDVVKEAMDVFNDSQIGANVATVEDVEQHAKTTAKLVSHQADFDLG